MRILLVNKFHFLKGGSEKYYFDLGNLLKKKGNEVAYFSMYDKRNVTTGDKEYFVEQIDLNSGSKLKALDVIYSKNNYKKMIEAIEDFKPDIVHLNNFQRQLSASIIKACKDKKIPMVYTAHDVQAICPAITMLDKNNSICEKCIKGKYLNCVKNKCNKGSTLKSIIGAIEGKYYRAKGIYTNIIDKIITPSEFYRKKFIEDGVNEKKITSIHNFLNIQEYEIPITDEGYVLYIGRLVKEKGIFDLINAMSDIENGVLYIAGDGPEKNNIINYIEKNKLQDRIKMLGFLNKEKVKQTIAKCRVVVVPSIWYENCPYSVMETLAIGKPVIGSDKGGIPELVKEDYNGYIYEANNVNDLKEKINNIIFNDNLSKQLSLNSKTFAKEQFDSNQYYLKLIEIYNSILNK